MSVEVHDNTDEILEALRQAIEAGLEGIGNNAVSYAKNVVTEESRFATGALRNSITHEVDMSEDAVYVGTNNEYAAFNEMGTGIYLDGGGGRKTPWRYKDANGNWYTTSGMKPIHFLKRAAQDHADEYKAIMEQALESAEA